MGHNTAFIGKVGNDFFGDQLRAAIKEAGIDDIGLCTDEKIHTTLAMVHTYPDEIGIFPSIVIREQI